MLALEDPLDEGASGDAELVIDGEGDVVPLP